MFNVIEKRIKMEYNIVNDFLEAKKVTDKGKAVKILSRLETAGYEAYLVGGCVRDTLMGREIHDYDITTNALPEEIMTVFSGERVIPTGLKHGTVTVMLEDEPFEITTYRVDGEYSDGRRPDSVEFASDIKDDLSRRDFTINAMAMDLRGSLIDPYGGREDIVRGIIRCVGEPEKRFTEDALRIMRAVRFSSQLGFDIEENTSKALEALSDRLDFVSAERIRAELDKLLCGKKCADVLLKYTSVIGRIIPEIKPCIGFEQHSPYHKYTVWEHIVRAVEAVPSDNVKLKRVMLFHDIGKPEKFTVDETGRGHFKGHDKVSADIAEAVMKRLRYDNASISDTCELIRYHSIKFENERQIKRLISKLGKELFFSLIDVKRADNSAKQEFVLAELEQLSETEKTARRILEEESCLKLSQLAVNGNDIMAFGVSGKAVGELLSELLELVIDGELENDKDSLMDYAKKRCK